MKHKKLILVATLALSMFGIAQTSSGNQDASGSSAPSTQQAPAAQPDATATSDTTSDTASKDKASTAKDAKDTKKDPVADEATENLPSATNVKHDGSKDDVSAIGNRNIGTGKSPGNWYSLESEIKLGKQVAAQVESNAKMIQDPVITEYINRIGQNLVRNSDARVPFTIKVIDADQVNAFALPGGFFYVYSGLILAADEEAEVAGVMAHEIAHVAARHAMRQYTRGQMANLLTIPLIFVGGGLGYAAYQAASFGVPLTFMKFSRSFEAEADYLGVQYMYAAGYDPQAYVAFFEKVAAMEKKKPGAVAKAFSDHPQTPDRIEKTQEEIARILPPRDQYINDTSEFQIVKARLAALENRHKVLDKKDNRPTLRRTTADSSADTGKGTSDDDRPTLKRRDN